ncbi:hypothetical protein PR202_ga22608 [Eleusine coracana subsp. coracana]|uniref:Uncharacterized protein n=1 Tax=Eleusine coracana subsp. coracana TaxID=191504 RepID=A0AAV5D435_ELECO|nr:hypothetical protein PR202_ga22608 [Eleusine coracana subsp. coracana]
MSVRLGSVQAVVVSSHNSLIGSPPSARWRALRKLCVTELFAPSRLNALREEKAAELVSHVSASATNDMLDTVLDREHEWKQQEGSLIDRQPIKGMFTDLFVAGSDTSFEWAMAALLQHPEAMNKVKRELRQVLGNKARVEESDVDRLPYLLKRW